MNDRGHNAIRTGFQALDARAACGSKGWRTAAAALAPAVLLLALSACRRPDGFDPGRAGAPPAAAADLAPRVAHVGEPVTLVVRAGHDRAASVDLPAPCSGGPLALRAGSPRTEAAGPGREVTRAGHTVTAFEVGSHTVLTGAVAVTGADGVRVECPVGPVVLEVVSVLESPAAPPRGPKEAVRWPAAVPRWVWVLPLVALLAAAVGLLAARRVRRRAAAPPPPPPAPDAVALAALDRLASSRGADPDRFFTALSSIVRRYLEDRFGLRAPESTTEEFLREAGRSEALTPAQRARTGEFLVLSDLVKFARHRPGPDDLRAALASARRLVEETRPGASGADGPSGGGEAPA